MHYDGSKYGKNRNDLLDLLTQKYGVRAIVQYYPLYRYPLFQKKGCGAYRRKNSAPQVKFVYAARLFFDAVSYLI